MKTPPRKLKVHQDKNGTHWTVPADGDEYPEITVWWSRGPRKRVKGVSSLDSKRTHQAEYLLIRQESGGRAADVVLCSPGQTYDIVRAITQALEKP